MANRSGLRLRAVVGVAAAFLVVFSVWRHWGPYPITNVNPTGQTIVAFGDSLTAGHGATPGHDYVTVLSKLCGKPIVNAGRGGDTTADALARLDRDVLAHDPRIVIVMLGGNDLLRGVSADRAFENLEKIVRTIQAKGAMVALVEIRTPVPGGDFGRRYRELARRTGCVLVPNILAGILANRKLMSDPIHPNDAGYELIAQRVYEKLARYL